MNKNNNFLKIITLLTLMLTIICLSMPFLTFKDYKALSGINLIKNLYKKVELEKLTQGAQSHVFGSTSIFLVIMSVFIMLSIGAIIVNILKNNTKALNTSLFTIASAIVLYGIQLSNSETSVSDFFGKMLMVVKATNGSIIYKPSEILTQTGLGARLIILFCFAAFILALKIKILETLEKNKAADIQTPWKLAARQFGRNKLAIAGAVIITLLVLICFFGPVFSNYPLLKTDILQAKERPGIQHIFGTDSSGRDILTRLMYGGRISITVGFFVVLLEILIGAAVGGIAGFYGGRIDNILMRVVDIFLSLPFLPVVIILGAVMSDLNISPQRRIYFVMFIIGALGWPTMARLVRGQILSLREQEYMLAAEALGLRDSRKILRHLIPNTIPTIIVTSTLAVGDAILIESALSFLGLGVAMPFPSWGNMVQAVRDTNDFMLRSWMWVPPGLSIFVTVLAINFMGDGLRDAFDPKMKK